ncbi:hypothetical protein SLEP1_g28823 [Rubroshorea leprosula]|uniref:DUF4283 domain-containing protein n=1 Tax=Rubroshorea leprosula TaxID=152421 RepID=A0AAV5K3J1_9ROSI|nr:hypothetical protein SLEP1_g28823 [Rubroshorea leprosula]
MARAREGAGFRVGFSTARDSGKGFSRQLPGYGRQFIGRVSNVFDKERKLNQIWIDSYRLKVKLAENVKRGKEVQLGGKEQIAGETMGSMAIEIVPDKEDVQLLEADVVPVNIADRVVEPSTEKDTEDMVMTIQNRFDVNGLMVNVALLGGRQVLLLDKTEGCLEEFFKCNSDLVESWFEWIHTTSLLAMPSRSRMVWLGFAGVPLKAWSERCFTELGALLGEVMLVDGDTKSKSLMDLDWWLVKERRNPSSSESGSEFSDDGYDDDLNVAGFSGEDDGNIDEEFLAGIVKGKGYSRFREGLKPGAVFLLEVLRLARKENPDFLFLQETKLEEVEASMCKTLWNLEDFDWIMQKSVGSSGGLLCIWNKNSFARQSVIEGSGFIGISGEWGHEKLKCNFVDVYAPCDRQRKALLWVEVGVDKLLKQIEMLDKKSEEVELNETEVAIRRECFQEMWDILRKRKAVWKQKSRNTWFRLGDANTRFFHGSVQAKRAQNTISGVLGEGGWIEKPELVKMEAVRYFSELFQKDQWNCPLMGEIQFNRISVETEIKEYLGLS